MPLVIVPEKFRAWSRLVVESLAATRAEIDALNVFPVPDSDTGTNAYLTFVAGDAALVELDADADVATMLRAYGDGLLIGAKGNSGVILSELVRGSLRVLRGCAGVGPGDVVAALTAASEAAYSAVGDPQEGTILSVAAAAAHGAAEAAEHGADAKETLSAAAEAARAALAITPTQMDRLARAGVVDAGGRALVVVLDATARALTGRVPPPSATAIPVPRIAAGDHFADGGPAYEVMYLLRAADEQIPELRSTLLPLGDSLVVVGGEGLWNVHVHVDDVGAAIEAGIAAGRPFNIAVTHFADQMAGQERTQASRAVLSAVTGPGLAELTEQAGGIALEFTAEQPLTLAAMSAALTAIRADEIIILPNREQHRPLFEAAAKVARDAGSRVAVLHTSVQVQGLVALAVHDPGLPFDDVVVAMSSAASATRHGAVTVAAESGMTMAGPCAAGDVLGVVNGDFAVIGQDTVKVAVDVLERLDVHGAEMVTLVRGESCEPKVEEVIAEFLRTTAPHVDLVVYDGRQPKYDLFIAVE